MKAATVVFLLCLAVASLAAAARMKKEKEWPHDSRGVLLAIARAPRRAREKQNPFEGDQEAFWPARSSSASIARSATVPMRAGTSAPPTFALRTCKKPRRANSNGCCATET